MNALQTSPARALLACVAIFPLFLACSPPELPRDTPRPVASTSAQPDLADASLNAAVDAMDAGVDAAQASTPSLLELSAGEAERILYPHASPGAILSGCKGSSSDNAEQIRCMISQRYAEDDAAMKLAMQLYDSWGSVAGIEREMWMEGGFRGKIHLVPELPVGKYRKHLGWVVDASRDFADFFERLEARGGKPVAYRYRPLGWKFLRSVGRTTPSAYADVWNIGYNVSGSLHKTGDAVRETLFHEIFHLNDGARTWSRRALGKLYDGLVTKCGTNVGCLTPYAPTQTKVRGGTYYAFQPDNGDGVNEYAAEIGLRYYREHREMLDNGRVSQRAFKCGPPENAQAWTLLITEFFGGIDLLPPC